MESSVDLITSFTAGIVSFINPCVLALVPVYISSVIGNKSVLVKTFSFVLGFSLFFVVILGPFAGSLSFLLSSKDFFEIFQNVLLVFLGTLLIFSEKLESYMMNFEVFIQKLTLPVVSSLDKLMQNLRKKPQDNQGSGSGNLDYTEKQEVRQPGGFIQISLAFITGVVASLSWTPCISPALATIMTMASGGESFWGSILLLGVYSLGIMTPFVVFSLFWNKISKWLVKFRKAVNHTYKVIGTVIILYGLYGLFVALVA